ncbi:hypothetical protein chiPu_0032528, partial [Chiloscyllium punctatum]|nr:hypothetical protein [Chiloscyllium punctatum]
LDVAALSYRQRLVRRPAPGDRVRDHRLDRRYLLRSLVSSHLRGNHRRGRRAVHSGNQGRRHHQDLTGRRLTQNASAAERSAADVVLFGHSGASAHGADELQHDLAPMRLSAMLDQIDALPGAKRHLAVEHRDLQRGRRQHGLDMRRHVIGTFGVVTPAAVFRRCAVERRHQVGQHGRIGILLDRQRSR